MILRLHVALLPLRRVTDLRSLSQWGKALEIADGNLLARLPVRRCYVLRLGAGGAELAASQRVFWGIIKRSPAVGAAVPFPTRKCTTGTELLPGPQSPSLS